MEHDNSYKLLFSHARMVEDLWRDFVHETWVQQVDCTTLERGAVTSATICAPVKMTLSSEDVGGLLVLYNG